MNISLPEAVGILRKWQQERRLIHVYFRDTEGTNESSCSAVGRIQDLNNQSVRVNASSLGIMRGDLFGCFLALDTAELLLIDWRDLPPEQQDIQKTLREVYDLILVVRLHTGSTCELRAAKLSAELTDIMQ